MTPLHYAARNNHKSVVECFVNQKADINVSSKWISFWYIMC